MSGHFSLFFQNIVSVFSLKNEKKKTVWAPEDQRSHFDKTATSYIEVYNANIKEYLDFPARDLKRRYESLKLYLTK